MANLLQPQNSDGVSRVTRWHLIGNLCWKDAIVLRWEASWNHGTIASCNWRVAETQWFSAENWTAYGAVWCAKNCIEDISAQLCFEIHRVSRTWSAVGHTGSHNDCVHYCQQLITHEHHWLHQSLNEQFGKCMLHITHCTFPSLPHLLHLDWPLKCAAELHIYRHYCQVIGLW